MTEKMNLQRGEARIRNSDAHGFEKEEGPAESSSNGHRLERVEVPPNKAKVWHSFETNMMQQLDAVKQDVQQRCGPNSKPVLFVEYLQHLLMLLAPNVRKVTTTLYDSESTAETIKSFFQPLDPKPLMDLKKQNEALLEGMKFRLSKHAAFQAKTVSDSEKQAKVLYSNTLLQIGGEMAAVTDLTGSSCAGLDGALKDQTTVHNIRWKKIVSGHNQTCNDGVQRVSEGVQEYQKIKSLINSKRSAWSEDWTHLSEYEQILSETVDQT